MMHWPSVPDALTAEPSTRPPPIPGCCAVWKHQGWGEDLYRFCLKYPSLASLVAVPFGSTRDVRDGESVFTYPYVPACAKTKKKRIATA